MNYITLLENEARRNGLLEPITYARFVWESTHSNPGQGCQFWSTGLPDLETYACLANMRENNNFIIIWQPWHLKKFNRTVKKLRQAR